MTTPTQASWPVDTPISQLPAIEARGLLLIGDPHIAATPPGQRTEGYMEQVLDKMAACLNEAVRRDLVPVILGDLFHWPRENPNSLLVRLIDLFRPHMERPGKLWVLVGNHDKYQARFTQDVSLAVLEAAGACLAVKEEGLLFVLRTDGRGALVGATPDGFPLPKNYQGDRAGVESVVWLTHHNIAFPEFIERQNRIRELPGIDWLINGHIHRPQATARAGMTTWANPGNLTRLTFTRRSLERKPAAHVWTPGCEELEPWRPPYKPFGEVFPDQEFPPEEAEKEGHSEFIKGLERLAWRRTAEGVGLKRFLTDNLDPKQPETELIWRLYQEVTGE